MESEVDDGGTWPDGPSMNEDNTWNNDPTNVQNDNDNTIWTPLESLNSPDCLLTIKNGDLTWKSTPSVQNVEQIGEWGNEKISVKLKVDPGTVSPLMLKYLKLEFHLYEGGLSDTRIAEALVYFGQMQHITAVDLSLADTRAALKTHNDQAVAQRGMIKVSFATSQATMNMSTQQLSSLQRFDMAMKMKSPEIAAVGSRYDELTAIKAILESQGIINIDLLLNKPSIRSGEDFTEVLQHAFSQSFEADKSENPMDVWFPKSERSHDMPLGHVPKLDGTLPLGLPKQDPIVRFQHEDQYMVTQIVGSVNQAYAEQAAAQDVVSTEFAAHVVPLKSANDNSQFIVIVKPKGHDIYLPTYGESCFLQLTGAKRKRPVVLPDTAKVAESILLPIQDHQDNTDEHFIAIIREDLLKIMDSDYDDETILSLRAADDEEPEFHAVRIEAFVRDNVNSLVPKATETIIEDETIWFPATRMDFKFPKVPADAQTYLASCPLEARDNEAADPGARKPISVELPFVELDMTVSIDDYMESVLADEKQRNLKAFVQRTTSDKTIRAEVFAINALHNPESAKNSVAIGARNVEAFKYIQGFQRDDSMRSVNLHEKFPVLEELSQRNHRPSSSTCPEQIKAHYEKLDEAKQRVISNLDSLPAGFAFVPGVAGSGKTELIKFIVAACTFGQGTAEPVPALYLAPNNQAVDDMANKFQGYFEKLGLDGAPSIIRLYGLDFETKSVTRVLAPGPSTAYQYFDEDKAQGVIQEMDSEAHGQDPTDQAYQFLAVYQFERMGVDMNNEQKKSRSKRIRSTNVSADTAAVAYYQAHADKYPDLSAILEISNRDRNLSNDNLKDLRRLVKIIFHDMLFDFKGIICTTPVVAANATVKRFQAELVFTDEAARQSELSSLISVAHYNPFAWFYLGDPEQLKPYVGQAAKTTDNPFIRQMSVSLLERAVLAGVELGWLEFTHRLGGSLRSLPSRINYGKRMKSGLGTLNWPPSTRAFANEMTQLLGDTHQKELSRVVVQFPFSMSTLAGTSSKNITHVRWVISQVKKMLRNPELQTVDSTEKARFLILPMYRAQVDLYRKMLLDEWTQRNISVEDYQRIEVRTLDSAQGEERDLVIVDYVQTHKAGFCVDSSRNCLATTRAKQCEILIINAGMINHPRVEESKVGQILEHATRFGYVLERRLATGARRPGIRE
ncbi:P-loop containing nucleoside triphosphate hydrolase protein [Colletotrichum cereale]|nr:P-loop containing nucleoside triphosphate hydrolase protein [Colletotrichum cereale]